MLSPPSHGNGGGGLESPSPRPRIHSHHPTNPHPHFHSTVAQRKLRRFNSLILASRFGAFCFSLSAAIFMLTNYRHSNSLHWYDFGAFRFVLAANGIVALYSLFEMGASVWEISQGATIFPEFCQVWFDFGHDQVFAYMLLSAVSTGTELARALRGMDTCTGRNGFCIQSDISVALGYAGFLFLMLSSLLSGFRAVCFIINGSRFHL